jgi:TPR repeat protein
MGARSTFAGAALLGACILSACAEPRYDGTPYGLPADVHNPPPEALAKEPCKYGDVRGCIAHCQSGDDAKSCNLLGVMLEYTLDGKDDPAHASEFYRLGCNYSYYPACTNLAWLYLGGRGVPQDQFHAMRLFRHAFDMAKEACRSGDSEACMTAGEFLYEGRGVEKDDALALLMLDQACAGGQRKGCDLAGMLR